MEYQRFRERLDGARGQVLDLVTRVEAKLAGGKPPPRIDQLAADFPDLPFTARVWDVWLGNTEKLQGVRRLDRFPYATHPTRMALVCCWVMAGDAKARDDSAVLAIVHDYLEEGDGLTVQGLAAMRQRFPGEHDAALAAVVLSEPLIDYGALGDARDLSFWRRVAYVHQARAAIRKYGDLAFANAALADKIDNLHDLDYIGLDARLAPDKRAKKLVHRIGYFRFVERALGPVASPALRSLLDAGIMHRTQEFGLGREAVDGEADALEAREAAKRDALTTMIRAYQAGLGL